MRDADPKGSTCYSIQSLPWLHSECSDACVPGEAPTCAAVSLEKRHLGVREERVLWLRDATSTSEGEPTLDHTGHLVTDTTGKLTRGDLQEIMCRGDRKMGEMVGMWPRGDDGGVAKRR